MCNNLKKDYLWKQEVAAQPRNLNVFKPYCAWAIFSSIIFQRSNILEKASGKDTELVLKITEPFWSL